MPDSGLGRVVDEGPAAELLGSVRHRYARSAAARLRQRGVSRPELLGEPPGPAALRPDAGSTRAALGPRTSAFARSRPRARPGSGQIVACHFGADPG
jgi:hypothetical protein